METALIIFIGSYFVGLLLDLIAIMAVDISEDFDNIVLLFLFPGMHIFGILWLAWRIYIRQFEMFSHIAASFKRPFQRKKNKREQIDREYAFLAKKPVEVD